jgi:hypothetical protein
LRTKIENQDFFSHGCEGKLFIVSIISFFI